MFQFECKNLGTKCSYIAAGNTVEDVKNNAVKHAQTVHKDLLAKIALQ